MTWIGNMKPTLRSIGLTMLFLNGLAVLVGLADYVLGANYMFLLHKPGIVSVLDLLGNNPYYYLLSEEGIALVMFGLLYLPISRIWRKNQLAQSSEVSTGT